MSGGLTTGLARVKTLEPCGRAHVTTLLVSQPNFADHRTPDGHPERADRIRAVEDALAASRFDALVRREAPHGDITLAELVHDSRYLGRLRDARPAEGIGQIDTDTFISDGSLDVVATGLGGALLALDAVLLGEVDNAFCAIRPPGHHAEIATPMGFCLVNTVAITAREAQRKFGAERIAIVDFDVHHGNGTQDIFKDDPSVFYASSHQFPLYPGTGHPEERGVGNVVNAVLAPQSGGAEMREAYRSTILPALENFSPDLLLLSAGFDAHERDPLAQLNWVDADFAWVTGKLMEVAGRRCGNRIVSLLEGGYDLKGLGGGVGEHVVTLLNG
jgi:acetoin utilization deacetylase AcuC-like enzyme